MSDSIRTLQIFGSYLKNTENWAYKLIDHLPDTKVTIVSKRFLLNNFYSDEFDYLEFPLKTFNNSEGSLLLKIVNKFISVLLRLLYPWYVERNCGKCDLMHSHFAMVGWEYIKLAKALQIPHVVSFYGSDYESVPFRKPVWKGRYHQLFKDADLFLCEGSHGVKILRKVGCAPEKIRIARLGVPVQLIPFWKRIKKPGELHLIQIATFTEKKGHKYTIEAFMLALQSCPNITLTFVGGERQEGLKATLQHQIKNTPAENKVFFLEAISFDLLYPLMKDYHVFIHPSCYTDQMDCEGGAPVALLDAQATGMPIISTTHCDISDEVIHEKTGLLSQEKDSIALAKSIHTFYHMGQREYDSFAQNARKHVEQNYDITVNSIRFRSIYDDLLNKAAHS